MAQDFENLDEASTHLCGAIQRHFDSLGLTAFDQQVTAKPKIEGIDERPWWGGYELRFKLIPRERYLELANRPEKLRMGALHVGPRQERTFHVDVSKCEFVASKMPWNWTTT